MTVMLMTMTNSTSDWRWATEQKTSFSNVGGTTE